MRPFESNSQVVAGDVEIKALGRRLFYAPAFREPAFQPANCLVEERFLYIGGFRLHYEYIISEKFPDFPIVRYYSEICERGKTPW